MRLPAARLLLGASKPLSVHPSRTRRSHRESSAPRSSEREQALEQRSSPRGEWSGYFRLPGSADFHDIEYNAIREAAASSTSRRSDKYDRPRPDADRLLDRVMTRDISKLQVDRVCYTRGATKRARCVDDGTITRLAEDTYRITAADPCYRWFRAERDRPGRRGRRRERRRRAALALQGRLSREVLQERHRPGLDRPAVLPAAPHRDRRRRRST